MPDNDSRNDDLRQWLRRGDPASGDTDLTLEETRLMRRRMLATVREARRSRFVPLAVLVGAAALAAVVGEQDFANFPKFAGGHEARFFARP